MSGSVMSMSRRIIARRLAWALAGAVAAVGGLCGIAGTSFAASCAELFPQGATLRWIRTSESGQVTRGGLTVTEQRADGMVIVQRVTEGGSVPGSMRGQLQGEQLTLVDDSTGEQWTGQCTEGGLDGRAGLDAISLQLLGSRSSLAAPLALQSMTTPQVPIQGASQQGSQPISQSASHPISQPAHPGGAQGGVFSDPATGLQVTVPQEVALVPMAQLGSLPGVSLGVEILPVDAATQSWSGLPAAQARAEMQALERKEFGAQPQDAVPGSEELLILQDGRYAKAYAVLSRANDCDVRFERVVRFYVQDRQVTMVMAANAQEMTAAAPQYFAVRPQCGQGLTWMRPNDQQGWREFFTQARNGAIPGLAKRWVDAFEAMLPSIAVGTGASAASTGTGAPAQPAPSPQSQPSPQPQSQYQPQPQAQQPPFSPGQPQSQSQAPMTLPQAVPLPQSQPSLPQGPGSGMGRPPGQPLGQQPGGPPTTPLPPGVFLSRDQNRCRMIPPEPLARGFMGKIMVPEQTFSLELPWYGPVCFITLADPAAVASGPHLFAMLYNGQTLARLQPGPGTPVARALAFEDLNGDNYPEIIAIMDNISSTGGWRRANTVYWSVPLATGGVRWVERPDVTARIAALPDVQAVRQRVRHGQ
ncbi:hypothetical protein [Megalodesulfovibrio paquesii]